MILHFDTSDNEEANTVFVAVQLSQKVNAFSLLIVHL
jgi:hypothetical protein